MKRGARNYENKRHPDLRNYLSKGARMEEEDDDDHFYRHSWKNKLVIVWNSFIFYYLASRSESVACVVCPFAGHEKMKTIMSI